MERKILATGLVACFSLGFLSLITYVLPKVIAKKQLFYSEPVVSKPVSLAEVLDQISGPMPKQEQMIPVEEKNSENPAPLLLTDAPLDDNAPHFPFVVYDPMAPATDQNYGKYFIPPTPLKPMVEFWRNVYATYDLHHSILHDARHLDIVYGVLDFEALTQDLLTPEPVKKKMRQQEEEAKRKRIEAILLGFDEGKTPTTQSERIIYDLFRSVDEKEKFKQASERIRVQVGQKSLFEKGLIRSGRYMPRIKRIFAEEGVPTEIANLVFVESMFQIGATSKVGAAGPWQIMPKTGRRYLKIGRGVDERLDPLLAAKAAAKILRGDYQELQSWPLAINAYNTGMGRMRRAARRMQTKNIANIILFFDDSGYGFASRNFYPEFLAAMEIAQNYRDYFGPLALDTPDQIVQKNPSSLVPVMLEPPRQ